MAFEKSFDEILNAILTDYVNQDATADISKGSLIFLKASAQASAIWGLYKEIGYVARQIFPDTADRENLEHHAAIRGLAPIVGETTAELQARLIDYIRNPPAGGNQYDYIRWAKELTGVDYAWCVPMGQGVGTIDVLILADAVLTGSEIPTADLLAAVRAHIVDICPINVKFLRVLAPEILSQDVTIVRVNAVYPAASAIADITAYMDSLEPGDVLYQDQLKALALGGLGGSAPVTTPGADVVPTTHQMIRPGVISVT